jgi:hypothetical protein
MSALLETALYGFLLPVVLLWFAWQVGNAIEGFIACWNLRSERTQREMKFRMRGKAVLS